MTRVPLPIAVDHPAFAGHFPGRPILPGVVLLDECLRAIAGQRRPREGGHWHVAQAKFLSFVAPGDPVHVEIEAFEDGDRFRVRVMAGPATDERVAMTGSVAFVTNAAKS